jgi:polysaccharide deacetylase 2 family uncharacterized protein YibQ
MPPRKTNGPRKTTARKPAAKKTTAKRPASKKPTRRSNKKKADHKLPITTLLAVIPIILLTAFVILRFSGSDTPPPVPQKQAEKPIPQVQQPIQQTVVKEVQAKNVLNTVKLFMFDNSIKNENLHINGSSIVIETTSESLADKLTALLKKYLQNNSITVDGEDVLTAEDSKGIYNISFNAPKPAVKKEPVKQAEKPKPAPSVKKTFKAKLAVVIDDCGYSIPLAKELAAVKYPVTFAVIPFTPYGKETAVLAKKAGKTLFLHFPMQPKSYPKFDPGKGALFLNMPQTVIAAVTKANFEWFPVKLDGTNNHTGSAFTESREKMSQALNEIKKYTDTYLDSYTSGSSVAYDVCQQKGMECGVNNIFLDNEEPGLVTVTDKQNHVHDQLISAAKRALKNKHAIAIGHLRNATVSVLDKTFAQIEEMGVEIVPVQELMD